MRQTVRLAVLVGSALLVIAGLLSGCGASEKAEADSMEVPSVVGLTENGACTSLERAGLAVGEVTSEPTAEAGGGVTVLRQVPAAGTMVQPGDAVDLVVSSPPVGMVVVPDVSHGGTTA